MSRLSAFLLVVALAVPAVAVAAKLSPGSRASTAGLGPVKIGMTKKQAERRGKVRLRRGSALGPCAYLSPRDRSIKASFMTTRGRIVRVDVHSRGIRTTSGFRVGDSSAAVRRRFRGRLRITQHQYRPNGRYLEFIPEDRDERNRRVVFETDGEKVTYIRAGRLPEVRYIEGCA